MKSFYFLNKIKTM